MTSFEPLLPGGVAGHARRQQRVAYRIADLLDGACTYWLTMAASAPERPFNRIVTFTRMASVGMTYVPYAGSAPAVDAVLGEHVTSVFVGYAVVAST